MGGPKGLPHKQTMRTKLFLRRNNTTNISRDIKHKRVVKSKQCSVYGNIVGPANKSNSVISNSRPTISLGFALQSFTIGYFELPLFRIILRESSIRSSEQDPIRSVFIFCKHKRSTLPFSKKFDQTRSKNIMVV